MQYNFIILSYWFHCSASSDSFNLVSYQCCALYLLSRSYRLVIVVVENLCFMPEWSCSYNHVNTHTQCSASLFVHFVFFLTVVFFFFFHLLLWGRWTTLYCVSSFHCFICLPFSIPLKSLLQAYTYNSYL